MRQLAYRSDFYRQTELLPLTEEQKYHINAFDWKTGIPTNILSH